PLTLRTIVELYRLTEGKVPLVACGGIGCDPEREPAEEIFDYLARGAALTQVHTGLIYRGPGLARRVHQGLLRLLDRYRLNSISDAVGYHAR
ncbi:MAG: dihydroorotate dehydrogenase (quinone), partial [Acidobacteria bacterium]|nr:dihydroorotate dehydrogenase (quinone) [Acidobacteriota bacterium]